MIEPLLIATARIFMLDGSRALTTSTSFCFECDMRRRPLTRRHVLVNAPSAHLPEHTEMQVDPDNGARCTGFAMPL